MEVVPLKENGKEITENDDIFIENPGNLVGTLNWMSYNLSNISVMQYAALYLLYMSDINKSSSVISNSSI